MEKSLPHDVEMALTGYYGHCRDDAEKRFALACHRFGISALRLSESHWIGEPPSIDGLLLTTSSIVSTEPMLREGDPLLWRLLHYLRIGFSGGAGDGWAQASWLNSSPRIQKEANTYFRSLSLPMVVAYFNAIKPFVDKK
jgi:hypothetical protein